MLAKDDLQDSSSWSSSPLLLLREIHSKLLTQYNCKEVCAPSQSQAHVGARGGLSSQDGVSQQQEDAPLFVPQLNRLHEASILRGEHASDVAVTAIPAQNRVTLVTFQNLSMWQPFKVLKKTFAVSRRAEQLRLRAQQRVVATVEDSVLHTEMENLESEEEDAPRRVLYFKPMSWLGQIRPHHRDEAWSAISNRHSLRLVTVQIYRPWRSYHSRLAVAGSFRSIRLGTTFALVPTTLVQEDSRLGG